MAKDKVHTHEETGVTHAHEGGNKPHDHNEAEYEIAEKTGCICVDSRLQLLDKVYKLPTMN